MDQCKSTRILYLDVIRILACFCILSIHFNAAFCGYHLTGQFVYNNCIIPAWLLDGVYLGNLGVGLFFIISGVALELSYGKKLSSIKDIGNFYKKRAKSIYPQYWLCFISFTILNFMRDKLPDGPRLDILYSLAGIDGHISCMGLGHGTYYVCGEWFLGCLLGIYLVYPFLSYVFHKSPWLTFVGTIALHYVCLRFIHHTAFPIQLVTIVLGMMFAYYYNHKMQLTCFIIIGGMFLIRPRLATFLHQWTLDIVASLFVFMLALTVVKYFEKNIEKFGSLFARIGVLTYPIFLVHHQIAIKFSNRINLEMLSYSKIVAMYCLYIFCTFLVAIIVDNIVGILKHVLQY